MKSNHHRHSFPSARATPAPASRSTPATRRRVAVLEDRLLDCGGSEDYVAVIRALVRTRDPEAIRVLASLLDSTGPIAQEAIAGLLTFGERVVPAMRQCIDSLDYDMIRHGHFVLASLGDQASKEWLRHDNTERIEALFERLGWHDIEWDTPVGNETDAAPRVA